MHIHITRSEYSEVNEFMYRKFKKRLNNIKTKTKETSIQFTLSKTLPTR